MSTFRLPRPSASLAPPAIIFGVLALALVVGLGRVPVLDRPLPAEIPLALVAVVAGLALALRRLEYGILMLPVIAVAVPFAVGTGTATRWLPPFLRGDAVYALAAAHVAAGQFVFVKSAVNLPLIGFAATAVLSTIYSNISRPPL